jgi:hypothetical protein
LPKSRDDHFGAGSLPSRYPRIFAAYDSNLRHGGNRVIGITFGQRFISLNFGCHFGYILSRSIVQKELGTPGKQFGTTCILTGGHPTFLQRRRRAMLESMWCVVLMKISLRKAVEDYLGLEREGEKSEVARSGLMTIPVGVCFSSSRLDH